MTDEQLVFSARAGDADCLNILLGRYRSIAKAKARGYFLAGGDAEDVEQEGMIGLFKAVRDFRADRESSFRAFADICVTRQILTAIKTAARQKHRPLNQYVSLSGPRLGGEGAENPAEVLVDPQTPDPADEVVASEGLMGLNAALARLLSGLEVDVLALYVEGRTYSEISEELGRHVKAVDNALQRIKRKLETHLAVSEPGAAAVA
ncbi:MAG: RNA polymerase sporulation sigma factor SigH [Acidimicrobiales bacterium]